MLRLGIILLTAIGIVSCEESNPYADRVNGPIPTSDDSSNFSGDVNKGASEAASTDDISEEALTVTEVICANADKFETVKGSFEAACIDGNPSVALVNALDAPYDGTGDPEFTVLQSDEDGNTSKFMGVTALLLDANIVQIFENASALNELSYSADNVEVIQTEISSALGGGDYTLTSESSFSMTVTSGLVVVEDERILTKETFSFGENSELHATQIYLKPGAPENAENLLADQLVFWIPSDNGTIAVTFTQQHADNRGLHQVAEEVFLGVAEQQMRDTISIFN